MTYTKKKRSIFWHIEKILDDIAMWHKKIIRKVRKWLNLTDYKLLWLSFGKGVLLGFIIAIII
tara:strand:+ start:820 stop:1008 length:189 start_codon:yes stop_codon:yes gene_type:complete